MELPGYFYDKNKNRYFKKTSIPSSSFINIPLYDQSDLNRLKQIELENKIVCTVKTMSNLQLHDSLNQKPKIGGSTKFTQYDSILASNFTSEKFKLRNNIFIQNLKTPFGRNLKDPTCTQLVACPQKDLLFAVWAHSNGTNGPSNCVAQLDVKPLLKRSPQYKLIAKNIINHYIDSVVEQIHPIIPVGNLNLRSTELTAQENIPTVLVTLVRQARMTKDTSSLNVFHLPYLNENSSNLNPDLLERFNLTMEFDDAYFCCDSFLNQSLVLGGENKCLLFSLSINHENHAINVAPNTQFNLKNKSIIKSTKYSKNGELVFCATNKGQLHLTDLINSNYDTHFLDLKCGPIVDLQVLSENELIISSHHDGLYKLDLRFHDNNNPTKTLLKFSNHSNKQGKNLRSSIDNKYQTLTIPGDDGSIRIYSIKTNELIRIINFDDIVDNVKNRDFAANDYLLDEQGNQIFNQVELTGSINEQSIDQSLKFYTKNLTNREQYQVVSSSDWNCLKKCVKPLMFASISDSIDLFY